MTKGLVGGRDVSRVVTKFAGSGAYFFGLRNTKRRCGASLEHDDMTILPHANTAVLEAELLRNEVDRSPLSWRQGACEGQLVPKRVAHEEQNAGVDLERLRIIQVIHQSPERTNPAPKVQTSRRNETQVGPCTMFRRDLSTAA